MLCSVVGEKILSISDYVTDIKSKLGTEEYVTPEYVRRMFYVLLFWVYNFC